MIGGGRCRWSLHLLLHRGARMHTLLTFLCGIIAGVGTIHLLQPLYNVQSPQLAVEEADTTYCGGDSAYVPPVQSATDEAIAMLADVACSECMTCPSSERLAVMRVAVARASREGGGPEGLMRALEAPGQFAAVSEWCGDASAPVPDEDAWSPTFVDRVRRTRSEFRAMATQIVTSGTSPGVNPVQYFHAKTIDPGWSESPWYEEVSVPETWKHRFYRQRRQESL